MGLGRTTGRTLVNGVAGAVFVVLLASCNKLPGQSAESHLSKARDYLSKDDYPAAILEAKNALQQNSDNVEGRILLGSTYLKMGAGRDAEIALKQARDLGSDDPNLPVEIGEAILLQSDFKRVLLDVVQPDAAGNSVKAKIEAIRGRAQMEIGRFGEAANSFRNALVLQPELDEALVGQARLAMASGRNDEASALIQRVLARSPDHLGALLARGDLYREERKADEAIKLYQGILVRHPFDLTAQVNLAMIQMQKGNFDEANKYVAGVAKVPGAPIVSLYLQALLEYRRQNYVAVRDPIQKVLAFSPDHLPSLILAGMAEYSLNADEQSEKYMRQAIALAPNVMIARRTLAASLLRTGQIPKALDMVGSAIKQSPNDPELFMLAGETYSRAGDFPTATRYFAQAASLRPKSGEVRTRLGLSRLGAGETDRAISDLESVIELDPNDVKAEAFIVIAYLSRNQFPEAMKTVDGMLARQPNSPVAFNLKGGVLLGMKDYANARIALEKAMTLDPNYLPAAVNLGRLDLAEQKPDQAKKRFATIIDRNPKNVEAAMALVDVERATSTPPDQIIALLQRTVEANPAAVKPLVLLSKSLVGSDPKKALKMAQDASAVSPNDVEVLEALSTAQLANRQDAGALATLNREAELQPKSATVQFRLATVLNMNENPTASARALRKALELKPDFLEAQASLALLELNAGNVQEANKLALQAQRSSPNSPVGYVLEGDAAMAVKAYAKAIASYEKAFSTTKSGGIMVKLHAAYAAAGKQGAADARMLDWLKASPDDLGGRYYLAASALKNRQTSLAIEQLEAILQRQPDNVIAINDLAVAYDQANDARAIPTAERAFKLSPSEGPVADTLGWLLVQRGDAQRGTRLLRDANRLVPDSVDIRMHLVQGLLKTGDKAGARDELQRVVAMRGNFPQRNEAAKLLASLQEE